MSENKPKILYVDDEAANLTSFKSIFKRYYQVYTAETAKEGLEILSSNSIQTVISDQRMPEMTGVEFFEAIESRDPDIPKIILTGYTDVQSVIDAINKGKVFAYSTKPINLAELRYMINNGINTYQLKIENRRLIENLEKTNLELKEEISQRNKNEKAVMELNEELRLFKQIADLASYGTAIADVDGTFLYVNNAFAEMYGYSIRELADMNIRDFHCPSDIDRIENIEDAMKMDDDFLAHEIITRRKDGTTFPALVSGTLLKNKDGEPDIRVATIIDLTEVKQAEQALRETQERTRSILEAIPDLMFRIDSSGRFIDYHANEKTGLLVTPENFLDKNITEILSSELASQVMERMNQALATGTLQQFEYELDIDGETRFFDGRIVKNGDNEVIIIVRDITEKIKASHDLKESEVNLTAIIENTRDLIWSIDNEYNLVKYNSAFYEFARSELGVEYCIGMNILDIDRPGIVKFVSEKFQKALNGQVIRFEKKYKGLETDSVYEVSIYPILEEDKNVKGIVCIARDITEVYEYRQSLKKKVEERTRDLYTALNEAETARDRVDWILKSVADGLIVTDVYNRVILMNRAAEDLLDIRFSEVINRPIDFAIQDMTLRERIKTTLNKQETGYEFDFDLPEKIQNDIIPVMRARTSVIKDKNGAMTGIVTIIHDVTQERFIDKMKTEFISTAAHELRTPLTSIQGFSEILLTRNELRQSEKEKFLTYINKQAVNLANIINDLLDIARIESGKGFSTDFQDYDVEQSLLQISRYFQDQSSVHKIKLSVDGTSPYIKADSEKMEQVLKNIVGNAIKYSPGGGIVKIKGKIKDGFYKVTVSDEGIGMNKEQLKHAFDKFYRGDASDTAIEGTGLGLSITRHIVNAHGGEIWLESETGNGTKVSFTIPLENN
ncbi:MAG: PAS domain S-box protein [Vulcanimicrobiota bacterium]